MNAPVTRTVSPASARVAFAPLAFDFAALAAVGIANALLVARTNLAPIALGLVAFAVLVKLVQIRTAFLSIPLHLPWLVFGASALLGVYISYDASMSLAKFYLILGGLALYYVLATLQTDTARRLTVWGLIAFAVGAGNYFVTQNDFAQVPSKVGIIDQIGLALHRIAPQFGQHTPHANLIAAIALLALPFAVALMYDGWRRRGWITLALSAGATLLLTFALVLTTSRGALLSLVLLAALALVFFVASRLARRAGLSVGAGIAAVVNLLLLGLILVFVVGGSQFVSSLGSLLGSAGGISRVDLYQQVIQLGQDFLFTGSGLNTFEPNFSTYLLLINVPFLPHAHNLWLQIWIEQGLPGLIAFIWFIIAYYAWVITHRAHLNWLSLAAVGATTLMLLHGLVDVPLYFSRVLPLMFVPIGLTITGARHVPNAETRMPIRPRRGFLIRAGILATLVGLILLVVVARRDALTAQWDANLGALRQSQIELPHIEFPHPTPHELRQVTDLSPAEQLYSEALLHDPSNRTAHTRLGLIALDRSEFNQAVTELEAAYRADPANRAVIKALGFAYVWVGRLDDAEPLLRQIPEAPLELVYATRDWKALGRADLVNNAGAMWGRLNLQP